MSDLDDDQDMRWIDERLLLGEPVPEEPELTALFSALRSLAEAPAPLPTPALAQVLSEGLPTGPTAPLRRRRRSRGSALVKIAFGTAVAAAAATGAAALEIPESVREPARSFLTGVADLFTPWEPQAEPEPEPQPQPETGRPSDPTGDRQGGDKPLPDPPNRPDDPGKRPETPAGRATPEPPGNPDVDPGPPDHSRRPVDPGPPSDKREPAARQSGDHP